MLRLRALGGLGLEQDGAPLAGAATQRRRLALLAILAAAGPAGLSRDRIAVLLWADSTAERARHALAQLLYILRQSLPANPITASAAELRLDPDVIGSDVAEFDEAVTTGDHERTAALYRGPFLDGVHVADAPEFERWAEGERVRRAQQAFAAVEALAADATARGDHAEAVRWSQRLAALDPLDAHGALLLMRSLEAAGNRSAALQHAGIHERLVRDHIGVAPDDAVLRLAAELRTRPAPLGAIAPATLSGGPHAPAAAERTEPLHPGGDGPAAARHVEVQGPPPEPPSTAAPALPAPRGDGVPARPWSGLRMLRSLAVAGTLAAVSLLAYGVRATPESTARAADPARPAIAVLPFSVLGDPAYEYLGEGLVDLLSANLDGAGELRAIDPRALLSAASRRRTQSPDPEAARAVAERLGARWFVLGTVVEAGGRLRISAILYGREPAPAATGPAATAPPAVARAVVEGPATALFALVDRLTADLLADVYRGPSDRLMRTAALTSSSLDALKAYLGGEQHLRGGRYAEAMDAFERATRTDSMFALAHYRRAVAAEWAGNMEVQIEAARHATRRAGRLTEHDQLLVRAFEARRRGAVDEAERLYRSVVAEHPDDVEAWYQLGEVLFHGNAYRGRSFVESRGALERVLALEPDDWQSLVHLVRIAAREGRRADLDTLVRRALPLVPPAERQELRAFRAFALGTPAERETALEELRAADDGVVWQSLWRVAVYPHDLPAAERIARLLAEPTRSAAARRIGQETGMVLRVAQGRLRAAAEIGARVARAEPWSERVGHPYFLALGLTPVDSAATATLRDRFARRDSGAGGAAPRLALAGRDFQPIRRAFMSGLLAVRLGDLAGAHEVARALDGAEGAPPGPALSQLFAAALRADALRAAGRSAEALAVLERAPTEVPTEIAGAAGIGAHAGWLRAEALRDVGRDEEALAWYASRADLFPAEVIYLAPSLLRAGEIHERRGEHARAIASYGSFLALWADADPQLRPLVTETARRVERLCARAPAPACPR